MLYHSSLPGGSGMTPLAQISGVSYIDLGVSPKTTYSYAVTALNAQGMSIRTAVVTSKPLE